MNNTPKIWPWIVGLLVLIGIVWIVWANFPSGTPMPETPTEQSEPQVQASPPVVDPSQELSTTSATSTQ